MTIKIDKAIKRATKSKSSPINDKYIMAIIEVATKDKDFATITQLLVPRINKLCNIYTCLKGHMIFHNLLSLSSYDFWKFLLQFYCGPNRSSIDPSLLVSNITIKNNRSRSNDKLVSPSTMVNGLPNLIHALSQNIEINRLTSFYNRYLRERLLHYKILRIDLITEKIKKTSFVDSRDAFSLLDNSGFALDQLQCALQQLKLILDCNITTGVRGAGELCVQLLNMLAVDLAAIFKFVNLALVAALQHFFTLPKLHAERVLFVYKEYTQLSLYSEVKAFVHRSHVSVNESYMRIPSSLKLDSKSIMNLTKSLEAHLYTHHVSISETRSLASTFSSSNLSSSTMSSKSSMSSMSTSTSSFMLKKSHHLKPNLMKELPKPTAIKRSKVPPNIIVPTHTEYMNSQQTKLSSCTIINNTNNNDLNITDKGKTNNNNSYIYNSHQSNNTHLHTQANSHQASSKNLTVNTDHFSVTPGKRSARVSFESTHSAELFQVSSTVISKPYKTAQIINIGNNYAYISLPFTPELPESKNASIPKNHTTSDMPILLTPVTTAFSPQGVSDTTTIISTDASNVFTPTETQKVNVEGADPTGMIENAKELQLPSGFDMENATMEDWQSVFDSLGDSGATFSLKFDIASALQRSIARYETEQKELQ